MRPPKTRTPPPQNNKNKNLKTNCNLSQTTLIIKTNFDFL